MQWFEDEEFWRDFYPFMFAAERFAAAEEQVTQILNLIGPRPIKTVLDLCCGPARHSIQFAQRGFDVTAVDRSSYLLDRAREHTAAASVSIEVVQEDMRTFRRPLKFDLACNLFTSFGYFENADEDLQVLRNIHESLNPGGVFVLDVISKERVARNWLNSICTDLADGSTLLQRPQVCADWTRLRNEWTLFKDGRSRSFIFEHTVYSGRELKDRLLASGFQDVQLFGNLQGAPYGLEAERLIAVAGKGA
jgi:SAM-dependent methyltransferase